MKFIIKWNAGWGESCEVEEFATEEEAANYAYEQWNEEAQSQAQYEAEEFTEEAWEDCQ